MEKLEQVLTQNFGVDRRRHALRPAKQPERNKPCLCGSGRKYKQCHGRAGAEESDANTAKVT